MLPRFNHWLLGCSLALLLGGLSPSAAVAESRVLSADELEQQGITYAQAQQFDQALPLFEQALQLRQTTLGPSHPQVADSLYNLGKLTYYLGQYQQSVDYYQQALQIRETVTPPNEAGLVNTLVGLGISYGDLGDYPQAIQVIQRAYDIQIRALPANHPDLVLSLVNLGAMETIQGNYAAAINHLERALAIQTATLPANHPTIAVTLTSLGTIYTNQGNYDQALVTHQRAIAIKEATLGPNHPELALSLNNLSMTYRSQGNLPQAQSLQENALKMRQASLPPNHPDIASSLGNLGILASMVGDYPQAVAYLEQSLAIREQTLPPNHPDIAQTLNNLGLTLELLGQLPQARSTHQRALALRETTLPPHHPLLTSSLFNLASTYVQTADYAKALPLIARGLDIEEANLSQNLVVGAEEYKRNYLATFSRSTNRILSLHLQKIPSNSEAGHLAFTTVLRRKGRLLDVLANTTNRFRQTLDPEEFTRFLALSRLRTQMATLSFAPNPTPQQLRNLEQLTDQARQLETQLSLRSGEFRSIAEPVTLAAIQAQIPTNAALIEYIRFTDVEHNRDYYGVYFVQRTGAPRWINLGEAAAVDRAIAAFQRVVSDPRLPISAVKPQAQALEAKILAPIRARLATVDHLLIAPDSQLNLLPFAALVNESGQFLVENYLITYLTSGRDLLRGANPAPPALPPVIVANPSFDLPNTPPLLAHRPREDRRSAEFVSQLQFGPLAATATEAAALGQLLPTAQVLTETQATETAIKNLRSPRILHLATHGFFLQPQPSPAGNQRSLDGVATLPWTLENPLLRSGIVLAGVNQRRSGEDDGVLTALEVSGMNLRHTDLVVLSACETGLGDIAAGDGVYGLRRALTLAGAATQVSSLWKVDDRATQELMVTFYNYLQQGQSRGGALRRVQLEFLNTPGRDNTYYWSAFIPIGDWRPLPE